MQRRVREDPILLVKTLWSEAFNLPPNDERLLSLTAHEALEQVEAREALADIRAEARRRKKHAEDFFEDKPVVSEKKLITGKEAEQIADKPHLTGDPEWDAIELAETDPNKAPLAL